MANPVVCPFGDDTVSTFNVDTGDNVVCLSTGSVVVALSVSVTELTGKVPVMFDVEPTAGKVDVAVDKL